MSADYRKQPGQQNSGGTGTASAKVCDDPEGIQGIMSYRNECHFGERPELVDQSNEMQGMEASSSTGGFNSQAWLSAEQSMSGMTPSSGSLNGPGLASGHGDTSHKTSGSQDDGTAADMAPTSNTAVGSNNSGGGSGAAKAGTSGGGNSAAGPANRSHLVASQLADSGQGSYQASPVSPHQNMMGQARQNQFFPASFDITQQTGGFGISNASWGDMDGQDDMQPVGDGVLRALINMGPMNAMDLSTWNPTNENIRR